MYQQTFDRGYEAGFKKGYELAKKTFYREHGAWMWEPTTTNIAECSKCHQYGVIGSYCMNCGADMRGDNVDEQEEENQ